jgi:hypothetical protein
MCSAAPLKYTRNYVCAMLVVDEQLARSVLCSTKDNKTIYRPVRVEPVHICQLRQTLDDDVGAERRHSFTGTPTYLRFELCGGEESVAHHVPEHVPALAIEQVAHISHLTQEDSEKFMRPSMSSTSFEQLGNKAGETRSVMV